MSLPETETDRMQLLDELINEENQPRPRETPNKGRGGLPKGYPLAARHQESISLTAARMRAARNRSFKPRTWTHIASRREIEDIARRVEQGRREPYKVVYDYDGQILTFGFSDQPNGGMPLNMARLLPWAKNPRVVPA